MALGRRILASLVALVALAVFAGAAQARVKVSIDLSRQMMHVVTGAGESYDWKISSGRDKFPTPVGVYGVSRLEANHRSKKYNNAPMPHSIFFHEGYAIHGGYAAASLGRPASHGCVRLESANAAYLYELVEKEGAIISVNGAWTGAPVLADAGGQKPPVDLHPVPPREPPPPPPQSGPLDIFSSLFH